MNKDILNQLTNEEQAAAQKLQRMAANMKVSGAFQSRLESQLRERYPGKARSNWATRLLPTLEWVILPTFVVVILIWAVNALIPKSLPAASNNSDPNRFINAVRSGEICQGPIAVAHGFSAYLFNPENGELLDLDEQKDIQELRDIQWSPDGRQLAVLGNHLGRGNIYLYNFENQVLLPVLPGEGLDYMFGFTWANNGEQLAVWDAPSAELYILDVDGTRMTEISPPSAFLEGAQFAPDDQSILYNGTIGSQGGLVELNLESEQVFLVSEFSPSGFAWSPDGSSLAYIEADRRMRETRLIINNQGNKSVIATLPFQNSVAGLNVSSANPIWSQDGKFLLFVLGDEEYPASIYLAYADGSGLTKLVTNAHAPAISADGNCLAYIQNQQVYLLNLSDVSSATTDAAPVWLVKLPAGDDALDALRWKP